ncbi:MAG: TRAP transporter large permease [Thermodesulfobacteriota bacterium]|nr:TRAP transporter large permease [Thermodesulfobacteriota bacterium]
MSSTICGFIGIGFLLLFLVLRVPVGVVMAVVGFAGFAYLGGLGPALGVLATSPYSTLASYTMSVVPLFVLMGMFTFYSGISRDLYFAMYSWLGRLPGGLAMATVGGCAGFAAICGSSVATSATMGVVALPEMKRFKYADTLATGALAAGGTIGILIPPSICFVVYGVITEQSIGKLFAAGFFPGLLEAALYIITIYILCRRNPQLGPRGLSVSLKEKIVSLRGIWAVLALFIFVMGGMYMGIFTPTEAGGIGAFGAFLLMLGKGAVARSNFTDSLVETGRITAMIMFIMLGAMIFGYFLTISKIPMDMAEWIAGLAVSRYIILAAILLLFIFLGCLMDTLAIIMLCVPIFYPVILALGFDPIWFGVIMVRVSEIGLITPPVGINVYTLKGVAKDVPLETIFKGIFPFLITDIVSLPILIAFPQISLFLPSLMG